MTGDVLLVEDDEDVREVVAHVLDQHGYLVRTAVNGREALAVLRAEPLPAVVLLDLTMPVMSGYQVLAAMAADPVLAVIPVIAMTAGSTAGVEIGAGWAGMLAKPVTIDALLRTLEPFCAPATAPSG